MSKLDDILGDAYTIDQVGHDRAGAIQVIKAKIEGNSELRELAQSEFERLAPVVQARSSGGRHGCHVSAVCLDLLRGALA